MLKGIWAIKQGDMAGAEEHLNRAIGANPNYAEPLLYRARLSETRGELERAKEDLLAARKLSSKAEVGVRLGALLRRMGELDRAGGVLSEVRTQHPTSTRAIGELIALYMKRRSWRPLEQLLADARKLFHALATQEQGHKQALESLYDDEVLRED